MSKIFIIFQRVMLINALAFTAFAHADPIIYFSDIISAPKIGWSAAEPNQGAVVTIWGRGFGSTRGNSYVTVNGVALTSSSDYKDTWAKTNNPTPFLQSITFQLNSTMASGDGTISVTVAGTTSNSIPFRVNNSKIYFTQVGHGGSNKGTLENPFTNPVEEFQEVMQPGDIQYFRSGTYNKEYNNGSPKHVVWVRSEWTAGTAKDPIAWVGYPGEDAHLDGVTYGDVSNFNKGWESDAKYHTVAKLRVTAFTRAISGSDYLRVVGNDVIGNRAHKGGAGSIHTGGNGFRILGNTIHDAIADNKLDHAIYVDGCQDIAGGETAYNYVYNNRLAEGPLLVDNHQNDRCSTNVYMKSNHWHSNVLDCSGTNLSSRGIGIYDLSWDTYDSAGKPDPALVYNNLMLSCGSGGANIYHANGNAHIYNNTMLNSVGACIQQTSDAAGGPESPVIDTFVKNNVCHMASTSRKYFVSQSGQYFSENPPSHNLLFGGDPSTIKGTNNVTADPKLSFNFSSYNPVILDAASPLIDAGTNSVSSIVNKDFFGYNRTGTFDIGAFEWGASGDQDQEPEIFSSPKAPENLQIQIN